MSTTRLWLLAAAIPFTCTASHAVPQEAKGDAKAKNQLLGTWKLVSAKYGGKESKLPGASTTLKHITQTQFMWLSYDKDGNVTQGAGGSYTLKGDEYAEMPEYGVGGDFDVIKGKTHSFKWKVEGNKWHHTGKLASGLTIEEVWERIEKN